MIKILTQKLRLEPFYNVRKTQNKDDGSVNFIFWYKAALNKILFPRNLVFKCSGFQREEIQQIYEIDKILYCL